MVADAEFFETSPAADGEEWMREGRADPASKSGGDLEDGLDAVVDEITRRGPADAEVGAEGGQFGAA